MKLLQPDDHESPLEKLVTQADKSLEQNISHPTSTRSSARTLVHFADQNPEAFHKILTESCNKSCGE